VLDCPQRDWTCEKYGFVPYFLCYYTRLDLNYGLGDEYMGIRMRSKHIYSWRRESHFKGTRMAGRLTISLFIASGRRIIVSHETALDLRSALWNLSQTGIGGSDRVQTASGLRLFRLMHQGVVVEKYSQSDSRCQWRLRLVTPDIASDLVLKLHQCLHDDYQVRLSAGCAGSVHGGMLGKGYQKLVYGRRRF
jgi:hypothetical protein